MYKIVRLGEWIIDWYHTIVPFEYRPAQLWDSFRCWVCRPYTTIKPRYLPHTFTNKSQVLPHVMFEVLSKFIEEEGPEEYVDWSHGAFKVAWEDLSTMYDWWHKTYIPWSKYRYDELYKDVESWTLEAVPGSQVCRIFYSSDAAKEKADAAYCLWIQEEAAMDAQLTEYCKRLIELKDFLWT